jgi:hypothetical protein
MTWPRQYSTFFRRVNARRLGASRTLDDALGLATATSIVLFVVVEEKLRDADEGGIFNSLVIRLAYFGGFLFTLFLD